MVERIACHSCRILATFPDGGGSYVPTHCQPTAKIAIIIPFRRVPRQKVDLKNLRQHWNVFTCIMLLLAMSMQQLREMSPKNFYPDMSLFWSNNSYFINQRLTCYVWHSLVKMTRFDENKLFVGVPRRRHFLHLFQPSSCPLQWLSTVLNTSENISEALQQKISCSHFQDLSFRSMKL